MKLSFSAINREMEARMREAPAYRAEIERAGRPTLSQARARPTEELVQLLAPHAGSLDEASFRRRCSRFPSAEGMARSLLAGGRARKDFRDDWVWLALTVLWERWAPDVPSFESLDERMQLGYHSGGGAASCEVWLEVWRDVLRLADEFGLATLDDFDERFNGTQCLFNWVQDLELELTNAGVEEERFLAERIRFCEEFLARFPDADSNIVENVRRAIAETHFQLGRAETADRLFDQWLAADPAWGRGWIGWSDAYGNFARASRVTPDYARAEGILQRGLAVPDLRDRREVLERLADLYREAGRRKDERRVRRELRDLRSVREQVTVEQVGAETLSIRRSFDFGEDGLPLERLPELQAALRGGSERGGAVKIGRNEPCPCGSGKKFKKCCGRAG